MPTPSPTGLAPGLAWLLLAFAGLLEIAWATALARSDGFRKLAPSAIAIVCMLASFLLLAQAMRTIPAGTAYAVWVGIGGAGLAIVGMIWLGEPASLPRIACVGLIVAGVIGLKLLVGPARP